MVRRTVQARHREKSHGRRHVTILEMEEHMHNVRRRRRVEEGSLHAKKMSTWKNAKSCRQQTAAHIQAMSFEGEDHDEAKLYELEDGRMYMEMGGKRYMMQEMEEELNELD
jgi:hypothetical protein